eukprot:g19366.t1
MVFEAWKTWDTQETAANASSKGGASKEVRLPEPLRGPADVCLVGADEGYDCHRPPTKGFKRAENDVKSIWAACGPDKTLLLQAGTVQLPIPVTKWLAISIGGLVGRHLVSNMAGASDPM